MFKIVMEETSKPNLESSNVATLKETVEQLAKENERMERNIREATELQAKALISGRSNLPPEAQPPKEDTPKEYAQKALRGEFNGTRED